MKRRKKKLPDLSKLFRTTCGWCAKTIPPDTEVFGGGGKVRPGVDLSSKAGQVMALYLAGPDKTVLVAVTGADSEARREGHDFVYMTCSAACGERLRAALQGEIELGKRL